MIGKALEAYDKQVPLPEIHHAEKIELKKLKDILNLYMRDYNVKSYHLSY
jgi:hypothetical protein